MKKIIALSGILVLFAGMLMAQDQTTITVPMLGDDAPSFTAESTTGTVNFPSDYGGKWKILFSHPADFTPVCSSEILELATAQKEFDDLNTRIVVISVDGVENHAEWKKSLESLRYNGKDPVRIEFPLVSDPKMVVAREYGMVHPKTSTSKDVRGVFIIDPKNKIRAMFYYPMNVGRNLAEIERTLAALQTVDKQQVLTPANWQPGGDVLIPYVKSSAEAEKVNTKDDPGYRQLSWYMTYKKMGK
jgi:peroxiredoxin 2/4